MKAYDLLELSGRNLREAILRNSLTTIGIGVGVASLVAMLSLGIGLQKLANRQLGRSGLFDSIVVTARNNFRRPGERPAPQPASGEPKPLDDAARESFAKLANVVEVYPSLGGTGEFRLAGTESQSQQSSPAVSESNAQPSGTQPNAPSPAAPAGDVHFGFITGIPPSARTNEAFDDVQGKFFSGEDVPEAVIMADFGRELLGLPQLRRNEDQKLTDAQANQLLGKDLILRYAARQTSSEPSASAGGPTSMPQSADFSVVRKEQRLKIVGIITTEPYRAARQGRADVMLPVAFAESLNMIQPADVRTIMRPGQGKTYLALIVHVAKSEEVEHVEEQIKNQGFGTFSILDASKGLTRFFTFLDLFLGIFGSLALAVASLGIVNTLVMAILERRREIGIMKAIGASDGDVKKIFFVEAGCMGLLGGALGVLIGWIIGRVINFGTNIYLERQDFRPETFWVVPLWLVGAALAFSICVSLGAGLYPASRAAKLDPVEALRHD